MYTQVYIHECTQQNMQNQQHDEQTRWQQHTPKGWSSATLTILVTAKIEALAFSSNTTHEAFPLKAAPCSAC